MIDISRQDALFRLSQLELTHYLRQVLEGHTQAGLSLSDDDADELRDRCGDRLQTQGFDEDYSTTEEGRILEELIDKLFIG